MGQLEEDVLEPVGGAVDAHHGHVGLHERLHQRRAELGLRVDAERQVLAVELDEGDVGDAKGTAEDESNCTKVEADDVLGTTDVAAPSGSAAE